ncbi:MAG: hypothetical protein SFU99_24225 [Saprospiraceae bacterium]|nr:hypothetical protein [Saprospiraceae bacterium]
MKNKLFFIVASTLALVAIAWACSKALLDEIESPDKIIPNVSIGNPMKYNQTYLDGTVEIHATAWETVINLKNITSSSGDDLYNRVYVLQQRSNNTKFISDIKNEKAELLFFKWGLIVALKKGGNYLFVLGNNDNPNPEAQAFLANIKDTSFKLNSKYYGFGLAVMKREIDDLKDYLKDKTTTFYNTDKELGDMGIRLRSEPEECSDCSNYTECLSGGNGSSSCSHSGASVTCDHPPCNACCGRNSGGIAFAKCCSQETTPN